MLRAKGQLMPNSPPSLCRECTRRATNGPYCDQHQNVQQEKRQLYDRYRDDDPIRKLYKTKRWQGTRRVVLKRDILCKSCGHKAATEVDHILRARIVLAEFGLSEFYNPDRCQGLCHVCHSIKTRTEVGGCRGTTITADELKDCSNITVVCGLPGSGKTTYVDANKHPDDVVFDYDVEMSLATGRDMHAETLNGTVGSILAKRDQFVRDVIWSRRKAWLIIARRDSQLAKLLAAAGAQVVELVIDEVERIRRLAARLCTPVRG